MMPTVVITNIFAPFLNASSFWSALNIKFLLSSQSVDCRLLQTLSECVCLSVCVSVGPAFTAYISLTMGWISIKLGENVGTLVRLIVLEFHKNPISFEVIMTSFLFFKVISKGSYSIQTQEKRLCGKGNNYAAPDTSKGYLLVYQDHKASCKHQLHEY